MHPLRKVKQWSVTHEMTIFCQTHNHNILFMLVLELYIGPNKESTLIPSAILMFYEFTYKIGLAGIRS